MASQNQFALLLWPTDGRKISIHHLKYLVSPKKQWNDYRPGDAGMAIYPGAGKWPYEILAVGPTAKDLKKAEQEALLKEGSREKTTKSSKPKASACSAATSASCQLKAKIDTLKQAAKTMPFANYNESSHEEEDSASDELEECNQEEKEGYISLVARNVADNRRALEHFGLVELRSELSKAPKKTAEKHQKLSSSTKEKEKRKLPERKRAAPLPEIRIPSSDEDPMSSDNEENAFQCSVNIPIPLEGNCECTCITCPYKAQVEELKKELEKYREDSCDNDQGTSVKAGIMSSAKAKENRMIELVPGTNVYIPAHTKALVFEGATSRTKLAASLVRVFYSKEQLKSVSNIMKLKNANQIVAAIISCCMRYISPIMPDIERNKIVKAIENVVTYSNRDQDLMKFKRKQRKMMQQDRSSQANN